MICFALTNRFATGNAANDDGPDRNADDRADRSNPLVGHGGDLAGLKARIAGGYSGCMGFTALWLAPAVLQVPAILVQEGRGRWGGLRSDLFSAW